ncbi:MAG: hypothetical protein Q8N26_36370 [Myxococcales bacterium]|nr:hypothetical protein [Myxococcales bacterium]
MRVLFAVGVVLVVACGPRPSMPDAGSDGFDAGVEPTDSGSSFDAGESFDAGLISDAGAVDGGESDAGLDAGLDAGPRMALDGGHGRIVGECQRVPGELGRPEPSYLQVRLDFGMDAFDDPAERPRLTPGAQTMLATPNAGGSSAISEAFAFEVLALCEGASLVKTETQLTYVPPTSKKTDILVSIAGQLVGVSVTRAVSFPPDAGYPLTPQRIAFVEEKLDDIIVSSMNVQPPDRWVKQLLVVMAQGDEHAATLRAAWDTIDATSKADTVLYVVVTDGLDRPLY